MRQRLGLAAALLGDPRVLVLDEPANGLDPQGIRWLRDFLRALAAEGRAVLVSSHVLAEVAQTADEVVVIARGRSVAQATLAELTAARRRRHARRRARRRRGSARLLRARRRRGDRRRRRARSSCATARGEDIGRVIAADGRRHLRARAGRLARSRRSSSSSPAPRAARREPRDRAPSCSSCARRGRRWGVIARRARASSRVICVAVALAGDFETARRPGRRLLRHRGHRADLRARARHPGRRRRSSGTARSRRACSRCPTARGSCSPSSSRRSPAGSCCAWLAVGARRRDRADAAVGARHRRRDQRRPDRRS